MEALPHEKQIHELLKTIEHLKKQNQNNSLFDSEIKKLEKKVGALQQSVYSKLTPWERIQICRHPSRPQCSDYIKHMCESFHELKGDRTFANDQALIGGIAVIEGVKCVVIGQEKGKDTKSRIEHNFGMLNPEGYRKALRLMQLAEKFSLPIVSLIDTPGAFPGLQAEERGQGWAIAMNLREMSQVQTPIIVAVIGEGCSGGALGVGVGDVVGMLEHAYYSVIAPEGCASILWKDASMREAAASALKLNSEDLLKLSVIDEIILEPLGGAHHDALAACGSVKNFILEQWQILKHLPGEILIQQRYCKYRRIGAYA